MGSLNVFQVYLTKVILFGTVKRSKGYLRQRSFHISLAIPSSLIYLIKRLKEPLGVPLSSGSLFSMRNLFFWSSGNLQNLRISLVHTSGHHKEYHTNVLQQEAKQSRIFTLQKELIVLQKSCKYIKAISVVIFLVLISENMAFLRVITFSGLGIALCTTLLKMTGQLHLVAQKRFTFSVLVSSLPHAVGGTGNLLSAYLPSSSTDTSTSQGWLGCLQSCVAIPGMAVVVLVPYKH